MSADVTGRVLKEILAGKHDGKLFSIVEAIALRNSTGGPGFLWRITLDGETWDAENVTIGELRLAEQATALSYLELDPARYMAHFAALVTAHHQAKGMSHAEASAKADAISQPAAVEAVELYEGTLGKDSAPPTS